MQEEVRQVKAVGIAIPEKIIDDEREILHRSVMRGEEIGKEIVTKRFEDEKRTLNERVVSNEK